MNQKRVVIIGAGGFAHELLDLIDAVNQDEPQYEELGYIVDPQYGSPGTVINDKPILGGFDWLSKRSKGIFRSAESVYPTAIILG